MSLKAGPGTGHNPYNPAPAPITKTRHRPRLKHDPGPGDSNFGPILAVLDQCSADFDFFFAFFGVLMDPLTFLDAKIEILEIFIF